MDEKFLTRLNQRLKPHKLRVLLIALLLLTVIAPFIKVYLTTYPLLLEVFLSLVLIAGIYAVSANRQILTVAVLLALLSTTSIWFNFILNMEGLLIFSLLLQVAFFGLTAFVILLHVMDDAPVTAEKIYGSICVYLLAGLTFALAYTLIESLMPGAFALGRNVNIDYRFPLAHQTYFVQFIYYSFVTLSTLGFGDIVPLATPARALSSLEAVFGQLYVAVLIARLVGLHIHHGRLRHKR